MRVWGITDGSAGMVAQVRALALALGLQAEMKTVRLRKPFVLLPNLCYGGLLKNIVFPHLVAPGSDALSPPWPDLVITCGRRTALLAMGMRAKRIGGNTRFIHIQDPQVGSRHFDLVLAMEHDRITGPNVIKTRFALHAVTPEARAAAAERFAPRFAHYPKPHVAVLFGGSTNKYDLTLEHMARAVLALGRLLNHFPGSLLITASRRTGEDNAAMLHATFSGHPRVYLYDGGPDNPYMGLLALADAIVVTNDSVNMMSESAATGKPLYLLPLPGHKDTKPARFGEMLITQGIARPLDDSVERWDYAVGDEMKALAERVKKIMSI